MNYWRKREFHSLLMFLPFFLLFMLFVVCPLIYTVIRSFMGGPAPLSNYAELFSRAEFRRAAFETLTYTVLSALLVILLAFPATFLIHNVIRNHPLLQHLLSLPYLTSLMSLSMIWLMLFNRDSGMINKILPIFDLTPQNWLDSPRELFLCILLLLFWRSFSYTTFSFLQALESRPQEPLEMARIFGASHWQTFRSITLPHALPSLMYVVPTTIICSITMFEQLCVFYVGGLDQSAATVLPVLLFHQAFTAEDPGLACAIGTVMILPVFILCLVYARYTLNNHTVR